MNVIFGIALVALTIGPVLVHFWPAIEALSSGAAAFLGALVGAVAALGAILTGARYNAKLNRDRDDRLREQEAKAIAVALRAELKTLMTDASVRPIKIEARTEATTAVVDMASFDIPAKAVYSNNTHRLGDLGGGVAELVVYAYGNVGHIR